MNVEEFELRDAILMPRSAASPWAGNLAIVVYSRRNGVTSILAVSPADLRPVACPKALEGLADPLISAFRAQISAILDRRKAV